MIKNFIYVEDGSIDVDELQDDLDETTKIILYRQGSQPPRVEQLSQPINGSIDSVYIYQNKRLERVRVELEKAMNFKMSKKLRKLIDELYTNTFC
jgi:hypothetical protein